MSRGGGVVTLTKRGGGSAVLLACQQPSAAWEVSGAGSFSAFVRGRDLPAALSIDDLRGRWLRWEHPTAGPWGGIVTSVNRAGPDAELGAVGFAMLLKGRVVRRNITVQAAAPGGLFRRLLSEAAREEPAWLRLARADEDGDPISISLSAGDGYDDVIPQIAEQAGMEWRVDADRTVTFAAQAGTDRTGSVRLYEGREILEYRWVDDLWTVANRIVGFGAEPEQEANAERRGGAEAVDAASVARFGTVEASRTYLDARSNLAVRSRVRTELAKTADPPAVMDLTIGDAGRAFAKFREGDTIRIGIGSARVDGRFRVLARSLDGDGGMRLAGTATQA